MRIKSLAISAVALVALAVPASAGAVTLRKEVGGD
jgi:hypothetical protein